jgi:hypothetical protein
MTKSTSYSLRWLLAFLMVHTIKIVSSILHGIMWFSRTRIHLSSIKILNKISKLSIFRCHSAFFDKGVCLSFAEISTRIASFHRHKWILRIFILHVCKKSCGLYLLPTFRNLLIIGLILIMTVYNYSNFKILLGLVFVQISIVLNLLYFRRWGRHMQICVRIKWHAILWR